MDQWWNSLSLLAQVFYIIAIPATVVMVIQSILLLFGIGDGDADFDLPDTDLPDGSLPAGMDGSDGLSLFSIRGVTAFFAVGGWMGVVLVKRGWPEAVCIVAAFAAGAAALLLLAWIMKKIAKMQDSGNVDMINAVGHPAKVYLKIPAQRKQTGKVTVIFQERLMECEAVTDSATDLLTGENVRVTGLADDGTLLVEPIVPEEPPSRRA
ncbi:MAG: hypothetical protein HFE39_05295 [Clostridiales bacterium]|jgi:hypothetical protein|nr:hypothetical protein [Clostridiales bacterium]